MGIGILVFPPFSQPKEFPLLSTWEQLTSAAACTCVGCAWGPFPAMFMMPFSYQLLGCDVTPNVIFISWRPTLFFSVHA